MSITEEDVVNLKAAVDAAEKWRGNLTGHTDPNVLPEFDAGITAMRIAVQHVEDAKTVIQQRNDLLAAAIRLNAVLKKAREHLEYCGYGDSYERACAQDEGLPEKISGALAESDAIIKSAI